MFGFSEEFWVGVLFVAILAVVLVTGGWLKGARRHGQGRRKDTPYNTNIHDEDGGDQ